MRLTLRLTAAATALLVSCGGDNTLTSPVVRLDLRHKLPEKLQRRILAADTSYGCQRRLRLEAEGARQEFAVSWRVFEGDTSKHITAVQVEPAGVTKGGSAPTASARVGALRTEERGGLRVDVAPLTVSWTARKGCGSVSAQRTLTLRADEPGCAPPKLPRLKLLSPD